MIGLDGIAVINVVVSRNVSTWAEPCQANPADADISGTKKLQTRITHNDGGPPLRCGLMYLQVARGSR